jgi:DNA-directed RNA polymerase subunit RPC12/RpoP
MDDKKVYKPQGNPLRFMWIAHFDDNTSIPEYDLFNFTRNSFQDVLDKESHLIKFGLYPFPPRLANEINRRNIDNVISIPFLPHYEINIDSFKRIIFRRRNFIHSETYHRCGKCGKEFQTNSSLKKISDRRPSYICPHCGGHDYYKCNKCGTIYERLFDAPNYICKCGAPLNRVNITSNRYGRERRVREHHIGYQETVQGVNKKHILKIDSEGNVETIYQ